MRTWCLGVPEMQDPEGLRAARGGSWMGSQASCRLDRRTNDWEWNSYTMYGFRLACSL